MSVTQPNNQVNCNKEDENLNGLSFNINEIKTQPETKRRMPSDLQLKLEMQLQKSRQARASRSYYINKFSEKDQQTEKVPLILMDQSSTEQQYKVGTFQSSQSYQNYTSDCSDQLLKDGFRLDELTDNEDLDLLPHPTVRSTPWCTCENISCSIQ
ncbi:protein FAM219A-like [Hydra vulgaris]|uniref:Protein FAM219A-like n=1 Tax=Hydra vulgaris TaxID=6087 RepID=A0ABM4DDL6_HYDVU